MAGPESAKSIRLAGSEQIPALMAVSMGLKRRAAAAWPLTARGQQSAIPRLAISKREGIHAAVRSNVKAIVRRDQGLKVTKAGERSSVAGQERFAGVGRRQAFGGPCAQSGGHVGGKVRGARRQSPQDRSAGDGFRLARRNIIASGTGQNHSPK